MPNIAEQARVLQKRHDLKFNECMMRGRKADALWHWDQAMKWGQVHVRFS